ncbi:hypothetical protein LNAOJCKE_0441 [Methylorubrum aminovorans]|uniref:Uncharacterized protein n=1 Tax=Methylorubrum aminovorans TaxID=269069 RepID=A0ABQ4U9W4_9HYPH|nr:hypothetical protein [Methylorubrum aminovorans]GJE63247.1 hypothetical protein LNAOJCKE_0441 [Methylorubrum aminovorans]GMA79298.1 hypothetical protein GCM10025880_57150 [Methylorubrum aminovorans]
MYKFYVSKVVAARDLASLVEVLNSQTRDGHVADQTRIARDLWLLRIACSERDDAALVRGL